VSESIGLSLFSVLFLFLTQLIPWGFFSDRAHKTEPGSLLDHSQVRLTRVFSDLYLGCQGPYISCGNERPLQNLSVLGSHS